MTAKTKTTLTRAARSLAAVLVGAVAGKLAGPDILAIVPDPYDIVVTGATIPLLLSLDKWLRYGSDAGES